MHVITREPIPLTLGQIDELLRQVLGPAADDALVQRLLSLLMETAVEGATQPAAALGQQPTLNADNPILRRLATNHVPKIVGINETTRVAIRDRLVAIIAEGGSLPQQVAGVRSVFQVAVTRRALMIARTENSIFWNSGGHTQMAEFGVRSHTWLASQDGRVRPSHEAAHNQCRAFDEAFDVGVSKLAHPGDPSGPPEEIIACRCVEIPGVGPCGSRTYSQEELVATWHRSIRPIMARERLAYRTVRDVFKEQRQAVLEALARSAGQSSRALLMS